MRDPDSAARTACVDDFTLPADTAVAAHDRAPGGPTPAMHSHHPAVRFRYFATKVSIQSTTSCSSTWA